MRAVKRPPLPDARMLLHRAVVYGYRRGGSLTPDEFVVGCHRPDIPCGTDPAAVNAECARRFAVWLDGAVPRIREVDPSDVGPVVDEAALIAADVERANAAQRGNKRKAKGDAR